MDESLCKGAFGLTCANAKKVTNNATKNKLSFLIYLRLKLLYNLFKNMYKAFFVCKNYSLIHFSVKLAIFTI